MHLSSQQGIQVLHVDDEPDFADLTATFLEREDDRIAVETANSASKGLQYISDHSPDCVVSDFNMPGMDGIEFLQAVREEHPVLPFILFTGKGSEAVASKAIAANATDYLQKDSGSEQYELLANRIRNAVRTRHEARRADRQEQLMRLTEFAGDIGGFEIDLDSGDLLLTDGTRQLVALPDDTHITLEEAIKLYHPDDQADVRQAVTRAAETGEETRGSWCLQTLDGDERLVNVTMVPATENGDVTTLRGVIRDVTERRKRRQELEQTDTLFQYAHDALFLVSVGEEYTVERVNPTWESTTGLSAEQVQGQTPQEVLGEQLGATVEANYRECIQQREPLQYEETARLDGEIIHLETRIAPVVLDGSVEYIVGATRDVTDREERERELSRLQQAIDDASVPISLADPSQPDNPLVYVNNAFEETTGYPPEEALGRNCRFLQGKDTDSEKVAALRGAINNEKPTSVELRNYRKDGTEFWNRLTVTPIYDDDDELVRYLGTQENVTERKERERELTQTYDLMANMEQLAAVGAWEYNPATETLATTGGSLRIYGLEPGEDLSLEETFEYFHPEDRERLTDRFTECLETGEPYELDLRLITAEGEQRWVTARGERVATSGSDSVVRGYIRDITEEKTRERQLTELNQASQDLLTAKTCQEVANIGVEAASDVLDLQANAIHISEAGDTRLAPVAQTSKVRSLVGGAQPLPVTDSIAGRIYKNGEPEVITDVQQDPDVHNSETDLGGHLYLPLGDHGILIAGSKKRAAFDQQDLAFGKLLAGNLVAAFDRIDREQTAHQRRKQLSLFFEESPLGAIQWDDEFNFERVNRRAEKILGYSEAELCGKSWETIVAEDDREQVDDAVRGLLDGDGGTEVINNNVREDGEILTCEWHNRAVTDNSGDVQSVFSKFQDVTDRENRKRELQEYETIIGALSDAVYVLDSQGRFTYVNDEFVKLVGYDRETIVGNTPSLIKNKEGIERAERELGRLLSSDEPQAVAFEVTVHPRDGDPIVCEDHMGVLPYDGDQFNGSVGTLRDITERREREEELQEIKGQYQTLVENFPDGAIFLYDRNLRAVRAGGSELPEVGLSPKGIKGATPQDRYPPEIAEKFVHNLEKTLAGESQTFEQEHRGKHYRVQTTPVRTSNGEITHAMVVSQNITAQIENRRELEHQNERLDEFASIVSHDLRSPLTVATGHLELAQETHKSEHLDKASDALNRSQALIDDLLTLAREGEGATDIESVALADVAESCWETTGTKSAILDATATQVIQADRSQLRELFDNLFRNAVEHGGNNITVSVGAMDDGFYVADTGTSIPESNREKIFEAGYSTNEDGTGFGLRIVEQIVDAHGWEVTVTESEEGGARFEVTGVEFADS